LGSINKTLLALTKENIPTQGQGRGQGRGQNRGRGRGFGGQGRPPSYQGAYEDPSQHQYAGYAQVGRGRFQMAGGVQVPSFTLTPSNDGQYGMTHQANCAIVKDDGLLDQNTFPEFFRTVNGKRTSVEIAAIQYDQLREQQMGEDTTKIKENEVDVISTIDIITEPPCILASDMDKGMVDIITKEHITNQMEPILITDEGELDIKKEGTDLLRQIMRLSTFGVLEEIARDINLQDVIEDEIKLTEYRKHMRQTLIREQNDLDEGMRPVNIHNRRISEIQKLNEEVPEHDQDDYQCFMDQQLPTPISEVAINVHGQTGLMVRQSLGINISPEEFSMGKIYQKLNEPTGQDERRIRDWIMKIRDGAQSEDVPRMVLPKYTQPEQPDHDDFEPQISEAEGPMTRSRKRLSALTIPEGELPDNWDDDDGLVKTPHI